MRGQGWIALLFVLPVGGCLLSDSYDFDGFQYSPSGASGSAGTSEQGGAGGNGGSGQGGGDGGAAVGGEGGDGGDAGSSGDGGTAGVAGASGDGGTAGVGGGDAGAGGSDAGAGGDAGVSGSSGQGGGGAGGDAGGGGDAGMSGGSGDGGGGTGGTGGDAGMSGSSGDGGGGAGGDAGGGGDSGAAGCASEIFLYKDEDGDGYGVSGNSILGCQASPGWSDQKGDCLDSNEFVHPGQSTYFSVPYTNAQGNPSYDYNCDGTEKNDPKVGPAPDCGGASCGGKEGFLPSDNPGLGINVLCGSTKLVKCVKSGPNCTAENSTAATPAGCN